MVTLGLFLYFILCSTIPIDASNNIIVCQQTACSNLIYFRSVYPATCNFESQTDVDSLKLKVTYTHIFQEETINRVLSCEPDNCIREDSSSAVQALQYEDHSVVLVGDIFWISSMFERLSSWTLAFQRQRFYFITLEKNDEIFTSNLKQLFGTEISFSLIRLKESVSSIFESRSKDEPCFTKFDAKVWEKNIDTKKLAKKFHNYKQETLRCAAIPYSLMYFKKADGEIDGLDIRIMKSLANALNFNYKMVQPSERSWGVKMKNGSWSGKIGMLITDQADFALSAISLTYQRSRVVDYAVPYVWEGVTFMAPTPKFLAEWKALMLPFPWRVWTLVFASVIVLCIYIYFISYTSAKFNGSIHPNKTASNALMFVVYCICHNSPAGLPTNNVTRVAGACWMLACMLLLNFYAGTLTSFFTSPLLEPPVRTVDDLVSAENMKWGKVAYGGASKAFFEQTENPKLRHIWENMQFMETFTACAEMTETQKFSCFDTSFAIRTKGKKYANEYVPYTMSAERVVSYMYSFPTRKGTMVRESFDPVIMSLFEMGIIRKWGDEFMLPEEDLRVSGRVTIDGNIVFSLKHFSGAIFFLLFGLALALFIFFVEVIAHATSRRQ